MNIIQKTFILFMIMIISQASNLTARPTGGMSRGQIGGSESFRMSDSSSNERAGGMYKANNENSTSTVSTTSGSSKMPAFAMKNKNGETSGSTSHSKGAMGAMMMSQNQDSGDSDSSDDSSTPTTTPTTSSTQPSVTSNAGEQYGTPPKDSGVPTTTDGTNNNGTSNSEESNQQNGSLETAEKNDGIDDQAIEDKKSIPVDQHAILEKLEQINIEDEKTQDLLSMASMDLLFNNFVYFKNFIVQNFPKDKILNLAIEFVNQIYPKETESVMHTITTEELASHKIELAVENDSDENPSPELNSDNTSHDNSSEEPTDQPNSEHSSEDPAITTDQSQTPTEKPNQENDVTQQDNTPTHNEQQAPDSPTSESNDEVSDSDSNTSSESNDEGNDSDTDTSESHDETSDSSDDESEESTDDGE